ncbi:glutamate-cysteine ligase family protein [Aliiglaciecola sp. CAU 1673]|uniref:glutamate-cysteine ligase family protein n=1 Tax=Aliiglaciecola sp. CAU 1673 TaxID=3032595 RepID=UPI0023DAE00B|nr:glutamate-cysteine ligase family protein [Aliiglaciecola sp. CAU 1673]MDF2179419.1 glutamate-cysteine ligase family protein [Aliiglaciecola sp. CAU 1673]
MGSSIETDAVKQGDVEAFSRRLDEQLGLLKQAVRTPGFGGDPLCIGAELEMYLVDNDAKVSPSNHILLEALNDSQFQAEINQYNLELNLSVFQQKGRPFSKLREEMQRKTDHLQRLAEHTGVNVVPIGILPTLRQHHLSKEFMTPLPRYQALADRLYHLRGEPFRLNITGEEPVSITCDDVTAEGANTSFQVHMMVQHSQFAELFNAVQLTQPFVTAVAANSGVLLGNLSWDETRVALFKQALDTRLPEQRSRWRQPTRVAFGFGWVRHDAWELFAEAVSLNTPLLPVLSDEDSAQVLASGKLPKFKELCVHMGTIWPWNRPVYCHQGKGHVRIELRAIPAGPTSMDMLANAAFAIGLANGIAPQMETYLAALPFRFAEYNFYRAAQNGLDAHILWPKAGSHQLSEIPLISLMEEMLTYAHDGLLKIGVESEEVQFFLDVIAKRMACGVNGARWQKRTLSTLSQSMERDKACQEMVRRYMENARSCQPVSQWPRIW